jgi:hypothetical protein
MVILAAAPSGSGARSGLEPRSREPWAAVRPADSCLGEHGIDPAWESRQALLLLLAGDQSAGDLLVQRALGGRQNRCLEPGGRLAGRRGRYLRERFARREFAVQRGLTGRAVAVRSSDAAVSLRRRVCEQFQIGLEPDTNLELGNPLIAVAYRASRQARM